MRLTLPRFARARQQGVTLTELMIALVLGSLVVLAATAMVVTSRGTYRTQDESTRLAESARFALELTNRLIRLGGYTNFGDDASPPAAYSDATFTAWKTGLDAYSLDGPEIVGANNSTVGTGSVVNNSDALVIRYFGTSVNNTTTTAAGGTPDGNVLDCAGSPVPQPLLPSAANDAATVYSRARAYNVLYVEADVDGEPSLKCKRQTYDASGNPNGTDTQTLIRGVEDFQVLYGEAIPQAIPLNDLDVYPPGSIAYKSGIGGTNAVGNWQNVVSVRVAMLLRSAPGARSDPDGTGVYHLFGSAFPESNDPGTGFSVAGLSTVEKTRLRRIVQTTVFVRNRVGTWPSLQQ